jgi:signal transduction histidine kinase
MQTSLNSTGGYLMAEPPRLDGTPAGEFVAELLRGLIHKQNNMLGVIQGFSGLVRMTEGLDETAQGNLDRIRDATQQSTAMWDRMLAAAGCVRLHPQPARLQDSLPLMESALQSIGLPYGVPVRLSVGSDVPTVMVDVGRLREILLELIRNGVDAVRAGGKPGMVAVDVLAPGQVQESRAGCVDVFVRNTGPEIPAEALASIFSPFKGTRDNHHFGLGLTIVAMLLGQMGATIGVQSQPGATTFWLSLPVAS